MNFDASAEVRRRLAEDPIGWLTTVSPSGRPSPRPVWFRWDGDRCVVYSQREAAKMRHIAVNDKVSLHLNSDPHGGSIIVVSGRARVLPDAPPADQWPGLLDKYAELLAAIGMTAESFGTTYTVALEVVGERVWTID